MSRSRKHLTQAFISNHQTKRNETHDFKKMLSTTNSKLS